MNRDELKNRIAGALYGVAIGDALGAPLEFMSADRIKEKHGRVTEMIGGGWLNVKPGETTDDTAMTLAVAEGILENPDDPIAAVGERFIKWAQSGPKDIGATCSQSIHQAAVAGRTSHTDRPSDEQWFAASEDTAKANGNRSGGNGALMRTVYPGLYYSGRLMAVETAGAIAQMTHCDENSTEACNLYTDMIHLITEAVNNVQEDRISRLLTETLAETKYDLVELLIEDDEHTGNPTGYVVDSFRCALISIYTTRTFEDAIVKAANLGGDADTIAAITGGLAGAIYGYDEIPTRWIETLSEDDRSRLDALAEAAAKNRAGEQ